MKLTNKTFDSSSLGVSAVAGGLSNALWKNLRTSQLELAPRTLVRRMREASGGRARYGSRRDGIRVDMTCYFYDCQVHFGELSG